MKWSLLFSALMSDSFWIKFVNTITYLCHVIKSVDHISVIITKKYVYVYNILFMYTILYQSKV